MNGSATFGETEEKRKQFSIVTSIQTSPSVTPIPAIYSCPPPPPPLHCRRRTGRWKMRSTLIQRKTGRSVLTLSSSCCLSQGNMKFLQQATFIKDVSVTIRVTTEGPLHVLDRHPGQIHTLLSRLSVAELEMLPK